MKELKCPVCGKGRVLLVKLVSHNNRLNIEFSCKDETCKAIFYLKSIPLGTDIKKLVEHYAQLLPKWTWG